MILASLVGVMALLRSQRRLPPARICRTTRRLRRRLALREPGGDAIGRPAQLHRERRAAVLDPQRRADRGDGALCHGPASRRPAGAADFRRRVGHGARGAQVSGRGRRLRRTRPADPRRGSAVSARKPRRPANPRDPERRAAVRPPDGTALRRGDRRRARPVHFADQPLLHAASFSPRCGGFSRPAACCRSRWAPTKTISARNSPG